MRKALRAVLAVGVLAVGACGEHDSTDAGDVCTGLSDLYGYLGAGEVAGLTEVQAEAALEVLDDLDPPAQIAVAYASYVEFVEYLSSDDPLNPDEAEIDEWRAAIERVNTYAEDECGLTPAT